MMMLKMMRCEHLMMLYMMLSVYCTSLRTDGANSRSSDFRNEYPIRLRVATVEESPYFTVKSAPGGDEKMYEGYVVDVMGLLATVMPFNFEWIVYEEVGSSTGDEWSGLLHSVVSGEADIAAFPFLIHRKHSRSLSFTQPFLHSTLSLLVSSTHKTTPDLQFLDQALNLSANQISFGVVTNSRLHDVLRHSNLSLYKQLWNWIRNSSDGLVDSLETGLERVRTGKFALVVESVEAAYLTSQQPCDVVTFDQYLSVADYSLVVSKHHERTLSLLNNAINQLRRNNALSTLFHEWWVKENCQLFDLRDDEDGRNEPDLERIFFTSPYEAEWKVTMKPIKSKHTSGKTAEPLYPRFSVDPIRNSSPIENLKNKSSVITNAENATTVIVNLTSMHESHQSLQKENQELSDKPVLSQKQDNSENSAMFAESNSITEDLVTKEVTIRRVKSRTRELTNELREQIDSSGRKQLSSDLMSQVDLILSDIYSDRSESSQIDDNIMQQDEILKNIASSHAPTPRSVKFTVYYRAKSSDSDHQSKNSKVIPSTSTAHPVKETADETVMSKNLGLTKFNNTKTETSSSTITFLGLVNERISQGSINITDHRLEVNELEKYPIDSNLDILDSHKTNINRIEIKTKNSSSEGQKKALQHAKRDDLYDEFGWAFVTDVPRNDYDVASYELNEEDVSLRYVDNFNSVPADSIRTTTKRSDHLFVVNSEALSFSRAKNEMNQNSCDCILIVYLFLLLTLLT